MMALRSLRAVQRISTQATARRTFATKHEDLSIEGRYATALFDLTKKEGALESVWSDLSGLRDSLNESNEFREFVNNPVFKGPEKDDVIRKLASDNGFSPLTTNFLRILIENKRISDLNKMVNAFEAFYRADKGQIMCKVTSAKDLVPKEQKAVLKALQARSPNAELMVEYDVNPAILGGLVVKMGDNVFDFSMQSRLDKLSNTLLAPVQ